MQTNTIMLTPGTHLITPLPPLEEKISNKIYARFNQQLQSQETREKRNKIIFLSIVGALIAGGVTIGIIKIRNL